MVIQHNIPALNAHRLLGVNNANTAKNLEKLSSGYKINRAGDDAAGLAISEKMRGQIRGLGMAEQNAENAISLIQTAEGGMQELHAISQRMREIAVQSTNGTYQDAVDRENLDLEFQQLKEEFDRITDYTNYNGIKLLNGTPYATAAAEVTQSISDVANGATGITGALTADETLTIQYNTDGTIAAVTDSNGDYVTYKVDSTKNDNLTLTLGNGDVITIDGDWKSANQISDINTVVLDLKADGTNPPKIDSVVTNTRDVTQDRTLTENFSSAKSNISDLSDIGMSVGDIQSSMILAAADTVNFTLEFDADGNVTSATFTGTIAAATSASYDQVEASISGSTLTFTFSDSTGGVSTTGTVTVDLTSLDVSDYYGDDKKVDIGITIGGAGSAANTPLTAAIATDTVAATANDQVLAGQTPAVGAHPDPNYVPGAHTNILFQVGANGTYDQQVELTIYDMHATQLGQRTDLSLVTGLDTGYTTFTGWAADDQTGTTFQIAQQGDATLALNTQISVQDLHVQDKNAANIAIEVMTTAINEISFRRAELGAVQNRLEYTLNNLGVTKENLTSAESTIRDVDMAKEMTEFTKNNILVQASQAMLAQANALPQGVLNLLR